MSDSVRRIRVSYGTAICLNLKSARQDVPPTTAYLLWDTGCQGGCSFCPRCEEKPETDKLSRVTWPDADWEDVCGRIKENRGEFRRICLQTGWNDASHEELKKRVSQLLKLGKPLCVTLHPSQVGLAEILIESGVECIGIGLDAASPDTYSEHKGRDWSCDVPPLASLMMRKPGKVGVHLIFGLGDTEQEFLKTVDWVYECGGKIGLFALTPVLGARQRMQPPELAAWRRVQIFRYLRSIGEVMLDNCRFENGRLMALKIPRQCLDELLQSGEPFRTAGCTDCNRPFYNERPGGNMYNFPRQPTSDETAKCWAEADLSWNP